MELNAPTAIAADSFAIIRRELQVRGYAFESPVADVIERVVHSTADFEFADLVRSSPGAIEAGVQALRAGCHIITDVNMVRVGISAKRLATLGSGTIQCFVADEEVRKRAVASGTTRSAMGMRLAAERTMMQGSIVAIGNAPTALYEVIRLIVAGTRPALVIGVPVGFVGTAESKAALMQVTTVPWIVAEGYKGGSTVAVAIVNALLRLAMDAPAIEVD